jgi:hypothetical protein
MEDENFGDLGGNPIPDHLRDEHETVLTPAPDGLPSPVETALAQYADSIEQLSADWASEVDPYTRGFVAGLRAAMKVVASVKKS